MVDTDTAASESSIAGYGEFYDRSGPIEKRIEAERSLRNHYRDLYQDGVLKINDLLQTIAEQQRRIRALEVYQSTHNKTDCPSIAAVERDRDAYLAELDSRQSMMDAMARAYPPVEMQKGGTLRDALVSLMDAISPHCPSCGPTPPPMRHGPDCPWGTAAGIAAEECERPSPAPPSTGAKEA